MQPVPLTVALFLFFITSLIYQCIRPSALRSGAVEPVNCDSRVHKRITCVCREEEHFFWPSDATVQCKETRPSGYVVSSLTTWQKPRNLHSVSSETNCSDAHTKGTRDDRDEGKVMSEWRNRTKNLALYIRLAGWTLLPLSLSLSPNSYLSYNCCKRSERERKNKQWPG